MNSNYQGRGTASVPVNESRNNPDQIEVKAVQKHPCIREIPVFRIAPKCFNSISSVAGSREL